MKKGLIILLALLMVMALVPTVALADGETVDISTSAELMAAITNQLPNQTWNIAAGEYDISRNTTISAGGQTGWYFPITASGITINGAGPATVITSSVVSRNGNWSSQDMFAVWGDNVTIQDLTIRPKIDTNKAIEVMGKDFTLRNVDILHNDIVSHADYCSQLGIGMDSATDYWEGYTSFFAGSIFFNPQNTDKDIGTATLDNVLVTQAWISCGTAYVSAGTLNLTGGTTIDFRDSWFAGYMPSTYGVISKNPGIINAVNFSILYDELADEQLQIFDRMPLGTKLMKEGDDTEVTAAVDPTYMIVIPAAVNFGTLQKGLGDRSQDFDVTAQDVVIEAGKSIVVSVASNFKLTSGTIQLDYELFNGGADALTTGGMFASFDGDGTHEGSVVVDTNLIEKAGSYLDTMTFTIAYQ